MKKFLILFILTASISSCNIYQVYNTNSEQVKQKNFNLYEFENEELLIRYNLWSQNGGMYFLIYNKTKAPLYIDWKKSNFILNGETKDYWQDIETTNTISNTTNKTTGVATYDPNLNLGYGGSVSNSNTQSTAIKVKKRPDVQLPPDAWKTIYVFDYIQGYRSYKNNTAHIKKIETLEYDKSNSPLTFRNYIGFSADKDFKDLKFVDNGFYVDKIEIMTDTDFNSKYKSNRSDLITSNKFYTSTKDKRRTTLAQLGGCTGGCLGLGLYVFLLSLQKK